MILYVIQIYIDGYDVIFVSENPLLMIAFSPVCLSFDCEKKTKHFWSEWPRRTYDDEVNVIALLTTKGQHIVSGKL